MNNQAPNLNSSLNSSLGIAISTQAFSSLPRFEQMKRARQLIMSYRESAFAALRDLQELKRFTNNDIDDFLRTVTRNTYGTENPIYKQEERINAYLQDLERYEDIINKAASNDTVNLPNLLSLAQTGFKDLNINQIQTAQSVDKGIQNDMVFHRFGAVAAGGTVGFFFGGVPGAIGGAVTAGEAYSTSGELSSRLQGLDPGPSKSFGLSVGEWIKTGSVDNLESAFINKFGDATIGLVGGVTTQFFILVQSALSLMGVCPALATFATASLASFNNAWDSVSTSWDPKLSYEQKEKIYEKNKHEYASKLAFMFFFTKVASMLNKSMPRVTTEEKFNGKTLDLVPDGKGGYYYASDVQAASGKLQTLASQYPTFAKASTSGDLAVIQQLALSAGLSSGDMAPIVTLLKSPSFEALNRILKDSVFSKAMQTAQTTSTQPAALTADKLITNTKYTNGLLEPQIAQLKGLEPGQLKLYKELVDSGKFQPLSALRTASGQSTGVKDPNKLVVASLGADKSYTLALNTSKTNIPGTDLEIFVRDGQPIIAFREGSRFNKFSVTFNSWPGYSVGHESYDLTEGLQVQVLGEDNKLIPFYFESVTPTSAKVVFGTPPAAVAKPSPPPVPPKVTITTDPSTFLNGSQGNQIKINDKPLGFLFAKGEELSLTPHLNIVPIRVRLYGIKENNWTRLGEFELICRYPSPNQLEINASSTGPLNGSTTIKIQDGKIISISNNLLNSKTNQPIFTEDQFKAIAKCIEEKIKSNAGSTSSAANTPQPFNPQRPPLPDFLPTPVTTIPIALRGELKHTLNNIPFRVDSGIQTINYDPLGTSDQSQGMAILAPDIIPIYVTPTQTISIEPGINLTVSDSSNKALVASPDGKITLAPNNVYTVQNKHYPDETYKIHVSNDNTVFIEAGSQKLKDSLVRLATGSPPDITWKPQPQAQTLTKVTVGGKEYEISQVPSQGDASTQSLVIKSSSEASKNWRILPTGSNDLDTSTVPFFSIVKKGEKLFVPNSSWEGEDNYIYPGEYDLYIAVEDSKGNLSLQKQNWKREAGEVSTYKIPSTTVGGKHPFESGGINFLNDRQPTVPQPVEASNKTAGTISQTLKKSAIEFGYGVGTGAGLAVSTGGGVLALMTFQGTLPLVTGGLSSLVNLGLGLPVTWKTTGLEVDSLGQEPKHLISRLFRIGAFGSGAVLGAGLGLLYIALLLAFIDPQLLESLTDDELDDLMKALSEGRGGLPIPALKTKDGKLWEEAKDFNLEIGTAKKKVTVKINDKGLYERIDGVDKLDDDELDKLMEALSNGEGGLPIPALKTKDGKLWEEAKDFNLEIGTAKKKVTVKINDKGLYERIEFTKGSN